MSVRFRSRESKAYARPANHERPWLRDQGEELARSELLFDVFQLDLVTGGGSIIFGLDHLLVSCSMDSMSAGWRMRHDLRVEAELDRFFRSAGSSHSESEAASLWWCA